MHQYRPLALALCRAGKGTPPKDSPIARWGSSWDCAKYVQDCHPDRMERICGVVVFVCLPCVCDAGLYI